MCANGGHVFVIQIEGTGGEGGGGGGGDGGDGDEGDGSDGGSADGESEGAPRRTHSVAAAARSGSVVLVLVGVLLPAAALPFLAGAPLSLKHYTVYSSWSGRYTLQQWLDSRPELLQARVGT